ncbi:MAG: UGMP family protein [Caldisphaera sp.]|uniref:KEOPS complex N(6)-L-threonylcarbamoyladenine synthase Kae1 n=1 Tax=Caldisphaera sp. TaxID=2060322 RepID=UPI000CA6C0AD|nr:MAG: UGMP family protein [Caldisphaera sp.]
MIVLGIESTAHTFGVGIFDENRGIVGESRKNYIPNKGGILPREVAQFFSEVAGNAIKEAISKANISIDDLDGIGVALGPGMGPQLRVGASVARALSVKYNKPLIPVNHGIAHLEIARYLTKMRDPVILYVSGGNSIVTTYVDGRYRVFGETLDIALGNLLDTFAREVNLGPPYIVNGNHVVDLCAEKGKFMKGFPYIVKGQDVSYSGLLTHAIRLKKQGYNLNDICYTLREIAFSSISEVTERCVAHTNKKEIILTGGVAANKLLNEKLTKMALKQGASYMPVPFKYSGDNGVMIALTALYELKYGIKIDPEKAYINQRWRIDEVDIPWYYLTI